MNERSFSYDIYKKGVCTVATNNRSTYNKTAKKPTPPRKPSASTGRKTKKQLAQEQAKKDEIRLFVYLAVCLFFFISNFGWCGVDGDLSLIHI